MTTAGLNLIAQALSIYDADLRLAVCNAPFQHMFDLPDALVTEGASFAETIRYMVTKGEYGDVADPEGFVAERVALAKTFQPHYTERRRSNGRMISVEGSPLPQGGWVAVYTDITEIKAQEELLRARASELSGQVIDYNEALATKNRELASTITALEEAKRQVSETEARTRMTTEMIPAHIAHVDQNGIYTYSNRRLNAVIPSRTSDIVGKHLTEALGPHVHARVKPYAEKAFRGEASVFEFNEQASARRIRVAFTPDRQGGAYILSTDVTEETQARVALQQGHKRALAAQMTSGLAHDFSNLLTIILGLQSKLAQVQNLPDDAKDWVDGTISAARRGGELLDRIASVTAQKSLAPQPVHLPEFLSDLATLARPTLPDGIVLRVSRSAPEKRLMLDPGMLQDSLLNLILNARDACGQTGKIHLDVGVVTDTWLEFNVRDDGPGFSDTALEQGCDPFFTTKGSEGSGLGLSMVYDMAKLAGGHLYLTNSNEGAQVRVRLPLRYAPDLSGGLVLLVEDDPDLRAQYREMLMRFSLQVIEATSVDEAIALSADLPDIRWVLSDINLGEGRSGIDLARHLAPSDVPVVLMTALPKGDPTVRAAEAIAPVLRKPFEDAALRAFFDPAKAAE